MQLRPYQKLLAWQRSYEICLEIYQLTKEFPSDEKFGLVSQMRRASSSVPINIAEGNSRRSARDHFRFLEIALSSLHELHCEILLSKDLKYLTDEQFQKMDEKIHRSSYLLNKLMQSL